MHHARGSRRLTQWQRRPSPPSSSIRSSLAAAIPTSCFPPHIIMPLLSNFLAVLSLFSSPQSSLDTAVVPTYQQQYASEIPSITIGVDVFGNDVNMPLVGAGTWQYNDTVAYESVCKAFQAGYTFVDTAFGYGNQRGVGKAIRDCWHGTREELFVMTKIPGGLHISEALAALEENLVELQLSYVDHVMVHYPSDWNVSPDRASPQARQETWLALENVYYTGQARSIGVSHYCPQHIDDVLQVATVTPSINQVEYHVGSGDVDGVIDKCRQYNITFMSYSPLCGPCNASPENSLINGKLVMSIASKYNVTGSQVSLRFIVQQALQKESYIGGVIPKSSNEQHIALNRDLFSFELSEGDMERLHAATQPAGEQGDCDVP
jgi:diketogulonate reductase-like aldo/keto reductase